MLTSERWYFREKKLLNLRGKFITKNIPYKYQETSMQMFTSVKQKAWITKKKSLSVQYGVWRQIHIDTFSLVTLTKVVRNLRHNDVTATYLYLTHFEFWYNGEKQNEVQVTVFFKTELKYALSHYFTKLRFMVCIPYAMYVGKLALR